MKGRGLVDEEARLKGLSILKQIRKIKI